jgi:hypothetical protein
MTFLGNLEKKVLKQLKSQRVAFLFGAGSSFLDGKGYPLMSDLWDVIKFDIPKPLRNDIQIKLNKGADGIENALDLLDNGEVKENPHRRYVTRAIAKNFLIVNPNLDIHSKFLKNLSLRSNMGNISIFSLNYDPLFEKASQHVKVRVVDGFIGFEPAFFDTSAFQEDVVVIRGGRIHPQYTKVQGILHLYKLHGSVGWYINSNNDMYRCMNGKIPKGAKHLMIPPQKRKATDTMSPPYVNLWSEFRGMLRQGQRPLINRLVSIGYGMKDEHINAVIESGLARTDFTLIILAKELKDKDFKKWSSKNNVIIVTNDRCSLNGTIGLGHTDLWDFKRISKEI